MAVKKMKDAITHSVIIAVIVAMIAWIYVRLVYSKELTDIYSSAVSTYPVYINGVLALLCAIFSFWSIRVIMSGKYEGAWEVYRVFLFIAGTILWGYGFIEALYAAA